MAWEDDVLLMRAKMAVLAPELAHILLDDPTHAPTPPAPVPTPPETPEATVARLRRREELRAVAVAAGVHGRAVEDFLGRCERDLRATPSPSDPTAAHATLPEFIDKLKREAGHLFGKALPAPFGHATADFWE